MHSTAEMAAETTLTEDLLADLDDLEQGFGSSDDDDVSDDNAMEEDTAAATEGAEALDLPDMSKKSVTEVITSKNIQEVVRVRLTFLEW